MLSDAVEENISVTQKFSQSELKKVGRGDSIVLSEWELKLPRMTFVQALPM
jgi:hypothetical protein